MRIIYLLIICSLAGVLLLWLGIYKKISRKTAAVSAGLNLALAGALLLLASDMVARTVLAPTQLPVGVVTLCVGGAYLVWLLASQGKRNR